MRGIGPFAGTEVIDFDRLGAAGLFLLEGPTGAGKSTIIDAITYALYGKVASSEQVEARMRSEFADPVSESVIHLVFSTGRGVYWVRRTPDYERAKRRGAGTTHQNATVKLWRLTSTDAAAAAWAAWGVTAAGGAAGSEPAPPGEPVSTNRGEVDGEIARAVGLTHAQFAQTIVLPQGQFASFLRAKPEDRSEILQTVFGTALYDQWTDELARRANQARKGVEESRARVATAAEAFVAAAGLGAAGGEQAGGQAGEPAAAAPAGAAAGEDPAAALTEAAAQVGASGEGAAALTSALATQVTRLEDQAAQAAQAQQAAAAAHAELTAQEKAQDTALRAALRRAKLTADLAQLDADAEAAATRAAQLEAARRAAPVAVPLKAVAQALTQAGRALGAGAEAASDPAVAGALAAAGGGTAAAWRQTALASEPAAQGAARAAGGAEAKSITAAAAAATGAVADLGERIGRFAALATREEDLGRRRTALAQRAAALDKKEAKAQAAQQKATDQVAAAEQALTAAREFAVRQHQARVAGIAAELAEGLEPGEPCPVCGGTDHPAPAQPGADYIGPEAVAEAEQRVTDKGAALATARDALAGFAQAVTDPLARDRAALEADTAQLDQDRTDLTQAVAADIARDQVSQADRPGPTGESAAGQDAAGVQDQATGTAPTASARLETLRGQLATTTRWRDTLAAIRDALAGVATRRAELDQALAQAGFPDAAAAQDAALEPNALTALERQVTAEREARAGIVRGLAEPDVAAAAPDPAPLEAALEDLRGRLAEAADALAAAQRVQAVAADRHAKASAAAGRVTDAIDQVLGGAEQAAAIVRLAQLATAAGQDNRRGITLPTYVLLRRFEDVVAAANERLVPISDGRYELRHSETREAVRNRKTGLALQVLDHVTDTPRDPRTLSGGETFYVSLALALGLADIVRAEAGGVDLGTLFIDEGFGSLDPGVLDSVLAQLVRLRGAGRVVGVVSHVEALKSMIAERVAVRRRTDGPGSTLTVVA
jgi:exonuclease SbcC